ncbi:P-loop containing nucleoside triphosphate hydrolase [Pseudocohnilembus persalinus]|uniref:p-loop containing nucleoside triphosphate hydrolase n=1 Tax=Pseudocohnilembus persalinus TaxID=266149 RepID=A0A0V0QT82_PSEPJ|nr:P-loop containing nucleoside triphosphate hydrolase [Pseudocohnilembus persalinus]|eukprot:KRX05357.1 P-loop containing nucleoside triphosphate hydrolase [Pseudocohnilembus persalinus]
MEQLKNINFNENNDMSAIINPNNNLSVIKAYKNSTHNNQYIQNGNANQSNQNTQNKQQINQQSQKTNETQNNKDKKKEKNQIKLTKEDIQNPLKVIEYLGKHLNSCQRIIQEESEIISNILNQSRKIQNNPELYFDLFEALYSEIELRQKEKQGILKNIQEIYEQATIICQKQAYFMTQLYNQCENYEKLAKKRTLRQAGRWIENKQNDQQQENPNEKEKNNQENQNENEKQNNDNSLDIYDWEVDIDLITNIGNKGWKVTLSPSFYELYKEEVFKVTQQQAQYGDSSGDSNDNSRIENVKLVQQQKKQHIQRQNSNNNDQVVNNNNEQQQQQEKNNWSGATVAVVGLYDKGKTFVLNNLTQSSLPSGKKCTTKGVSFKNVNVDNGTNLILVDTAGSYSPVQIKNDLSIVEKEATETFLQDLVFEISDYFICVVNDFTSLDQRYLDRISRNLQNSTSKTFREIIVIHNLKEVESQEILEHAWENQVTQIYKNGMKQQTKVAAYDAQSEQVIEKSVAWFKTQYTRHICIINDDCPYGRQVNPWVFGLLKYWLKSVFVPVNRNFNVIESILTFSALKLSSYFKTSLTLSLQDTNDKYVKTINTVQQENIQLPQFTIDASGLVNSMRPDSFTPQVDIVADDKYYIYMDIPGLCKDDISIYRQNVVSVIKGKKDKPYIYNNKKLERNERKYGEFALSFRIPEIFERKWKRYDVKNGVLCIEYEKDQDDNSQRSSQKNIKSKKYDKNDENFSSQINYSNQGQDYIKQDQQLSQDTSQTSIEDKNDKNENLQEQNKQKINQEN